MSNTCIRFLCILILVVMSALFEILIASGQTKMSADELCAIYARQISEIPSISFVSSSTDYEEPGTITDGNIQTDHWTVDIAGKRYRKLYKTDKSVYESILNNDTSMSVSVFPDPDLQGQQLMGITSYVDIPKDHWQQSIRLMYIACPLGYIENETVCISIVDIVQSGKKTIFQDEQGFALQSQTEEFNVRIWFDLEKNYTVRRIHITRQNSPSTPWHFTTLEYKVNDFQKIGNSWFPSTYTVRVSFPGGTEHFNLPPGIAPPLGVSQNMAQKPRTYVANVTLTDVKFPLQLTEADFQISIPIPNGTSVTMMDVLHIDHIWLDGKIVPKTDEAMLAIARGGHKFMPGPDEPRFWLMGIGIALILFACGKKTYDYFKNKK